MGGPTRVLNRGGKEVVAVVRAEGASDHEGKQADEWW